MGLGAHCVEAKMEWDAEPRLVGQEYWERADVDMWWMEQREKAFRDPGEVMNFG